MIGRIFAFDFGDRRIGVAVSDPSGTIAQGRDTIVRNGDTVPWRVILARLKEEGAVAAVVGDPISMDGSAGERSRISRAFAEELGERAGLPVELFDERLTSVQAERILVETGRTGRRRKKEDVDRVAAVLILQAWLDREAREGK